MRLILFLCFMLLITGCSIKIHEETIVGTVAAVSYSNSLLSGGLCYSMVLDNGNASSIKQETCINDKYASMEDADNIARFIGKKVKMRTSCVRFSNCKINIEAHNE